MIKLPKLFFGWSNLKWLIQEVNKMYSGRTESFFSKKRVESGIGFIILQWGMIYYLKNKIETMDMMEMTLWAGIEGAVCGYMINKIEKNNISPSDTTKDEKQ